MAFQRLLYQQLTPFFEQYDFFLLPEKNLYRRATSIGFQSIMPTLTVYNDETVLDVKLGCRNEQVEQIAQQFVSSPAVSHQDAVTITVSISQFSGFKIAPFKLSTEKELVTTCRQIESFFQTSGFTFLNFSCTLPVLDHLLNEQPSRPCQYVYNQMHRYYKGLTTASLTHTNQFDSLCDQYRRLLVKQTHNPYEPLQFERLIAYLRYYFSN
ncbi:hypothetical protein [Spirosoma linguale]